MGMKCANCGGPSVFTNARFCSLCGAPISVGATEAFRTTEIQQPFWKRDIGAWALAFSLALMFFMFYSLVHSGSKLGTNEISSAAFWTGIAGAYVWRKRMKSGWIGFGVRIVCGLVALLSAIVVASFTRSL